MAYKYKPSTKKQAMWGHTANIKSFQKGGPQVYTGSEKPSEGQWRTIRGHPVFIKGGTASGKGAAVKSGMKKGSMSKPKPKKRLSNAAWWTKALSEDQKTYVKGMKAQFGKKAFKSDVGNRIYD